MAEQNRIGNFFSNLFRGNREEVGPDIVKLNPAQPLVAEQFRVSADSIIDNETAYSDVEIIHRCVEIIINGLISVPFLVDEGPAKKVNKLLNERPNPFEDRVRLFRRAYLDFFLDGNIFFYYDTDVEGDALHVLPANNVEIITNNKTFVERYEYSINSSEDQVLSLFGSRTTKKTKKDIIVFDPDKIIHVKDDNESSIFRGKSRLTSLQRLIQLYYQLIDFQHQFFENNAVLGVVLETDNVLSDKIKQRLLDKWRITYTTVFNGARSPAILDGGLKINKFSNINFQELDFEKSIERLQQDMAKGLGVPYVLLKAGNNANIGPNESIFYTQTVIPILESVASAFEQFFVRTKVKVDRKSIGVLQPDFKIQASYFTSLVNSGIMTPNEAREQLRLSPIGDEEDKLRVPRNITGSATNPSIGGRPTEGAKKPTEGSVQNEQSNNQ